MRSILIFSFLMLITVLESCQDSKTISAPDVSDIEIDFTIKRFDTALAELDLSNIKLEYPELRKDYPELSDLYFKRIVPLYDNNKDTLFNRIQSFLKDNRIKKLNDTISAIYPDLKFLSKELEPALKYYKYYFPKKELPEFYSFFSEFAYQPIIFNGSRNNNAIGIGLDMFLGEDFDYKKIDPANPVFSAYLTRTYNKDHMSKKAIDVIVEDLVGVPPGKRFIDKMINRGKKIYISKKLQPFVADTIIFEYTPSQLDWVNKNQLQMWDFFLEQNIMYETNHFKITKFLDYSPTTKGMPAESPGRTASFIGYKIVEAYMQRQKETTLEELIGIRNSQQILEKSKYKPRRR